jgi:hypothetical protein
LCFNLRCNPTNILFLMILVKYESDYIIQKLQFLSSIISVIPTSFLPSRYSELNIIKIVDSSRWNRLYMICQKASSLEGENEWQGLLGKKEQ